ncbi:unnamed protein product [Urochloa humidicola]
MRVVGNLLHRRHRLDKSSTPSPQPARCRHSIRNVLARYAGAAAAAAVSIEFSSLLSGGKRNHDALAALHHATSDDAGGIKDDEKEEPGPRTLPANHPYTIRVRRIAADLIAAAGDEKTFARHPRLWARIRRPRWLFDIDWKVDVNVDWNVVRAYSRCDGEIRVTLGHLYVFPKDADLATTLGHEVAHVIAGHIIERYKKRLWTSLLVNFTEELLDVPGDKIARDAWESLYMRPCNFRQEFEADRIGLLLLGAVGYHPRIAPNHFFMIEKMSKRLGSDYDDLTATHPPHLIRAQKLMQTKVMNEALELYVQALRSGKFSTRPLDSAASALKLQLACCKFYIDEWLQGVWASLLPRNLWDHVKNSVRNSSTVMVYLAQTNSRWIRDIVGRSSSLLAQAIYRNLSFGIRNASGWQLHNNHIDNTFFFSQRTMQGAHCANRMVFHGDIGSPCANLPWAPPEVKHLVWLLLHRSPERHGLQSHGECLLCNNRAPESAVHIAFNCSYAKQVWRNIMSRVGVPMILPPVVPSVDLWWKHLRSLFPEDKTKALDTRSVRVDRLASVVGTERKASRGGEDDDKHAADGQD